ncbi:MAG: leucine-rich repeat domain-containing protein [Bacteroidales bacterium]|nr:leucine-rich repeat domain-containing protein [Bacteroidales bacterium]
MISGCESPKKIRGFGEITLSSGLKIEVPNEKEFNKLCDTLDPDASLIINGTSFTKSTLKGFAFGSEFDLSSIRDSFLDECISLNQPLTIPACVQSIGNNFLAACTSFNQLLTISNVMELGDNFLYNCASFNQSLIIPVSVITIGSGFLYGCSNYNETIYCHGNTSKPSG